MENSNNLKAYFKTGKEDLLLTSVLQSDASPCGKQPLLMGRQPYMHACRILGCVFYRNGSVLDIFCNLSFHSVTCVLKTFSLMFEIDLLQSFPYSYVVFCFKALPKYIRQLGHSHIFITRHDIVMKFHYREFRASMQMYA